MSKTTPEEAKRLADKHILVERLNTSMHPSHCLVACDMTSCTCQPKRHEVEKPKAIDLAQPAQPVAQGEPIGWLKPNESYAPDAFRWSQTDTHIRPLFFAASAPSQPAAPVELPVVATALLQHALKLADRLPDSEIAYTLRLYLNGLTESPDCYSDEQIIRASVQAMPHTNPDIADDLLQGHAIHTEMADILAIWKVASLRSIDTLTIYLDEDAIDVGQFYRAKGFEKLPPTPTMSGAEIRACGWKKNNYQMYIIPQNGAPSIPIGDAQAIPLINGMRFWCIPPATAGVSLDEPPPPTPGIEPEQGGNHG